MFVDMLVNLMLCNTREPTTSTHEDSDYQKTVWKLVHTENERQREGQVETNKNEKIEKENNRPPKFGLTDKRHEHISSLCTASSLRRDLSLIKRDLQCDV